MVFWCFGVGLVLFLCFVDLSKGERSVAVFYPLDLGHGLVKNFQVWRISVAINILLRSDGLQSGRVDSTTTK